MKKIIILSLIAFQMFCIGCNVPTEEITVLPESNAQISSSSTRLLQPIFEDNFNQTGRIPDTSKWALCPKISPAWGKYLSESYNQAFVENGNLVLIAEKVNGEYKTGGVQTLGKFDFKYGKVDVHARFTKTSQGGWPAIWMMPSVPKYNEDWPACGEIDIMEQLNHEGFVHQTIHNHYKNTLNILTPAFHKTATYNRNTYNTYSVEWTPDYLLFSVNGQAGLKYPNLRLFDEETKKQWPFDAPFYLILNYALGGVGTWPGPIIDTQLPAKMEIDWVRIYPYAEPSNEIISGTAYNIATSLNGTGMLDITGGGTNNGTPVILWENNGADNQKWIITDLNNGFYKLNAGHALDMALTVPENSHVNGTQLHISQYSGATGQQWKITSIGGGRFTLSPACAPSSAMDVCAESTANGTKIILWEDNKKDNQQFVLKLAM